eukprot:1030409-Pelagomonas_calceolata.AAC.2
MALQCKSALLGGDWVPPGGLSHPRPIPNIAPSRRVYQRRMHISRVITRTSAPKPESDPTLDACSSAIATVPSNTHMQEVSSKKHLGEEGMTRQTQRLQSCTKSTMGMRGPTQA